MSISQSQKDDLATAVYIEMQRLFYVLDRLKTDEELAFLAEVEAAMKAAILTFGDLSATPDED